MSNDDFWKSVIRISDQQRRLPQLLRRMSGVPIQPFHAERLPYRDQDSILAGDLTMTVDHDEALGIFVSHCPELDLYSQGETLQEALDALQETVAGWLCLCLRRGIIRDIQGTKATNQPGTFAVLSTPLRELSPESAAALEEIVAAA